jgi:hypothetical protein
MTKFVLPEERREITQEGKGCYEAIPLRRNYLRMHSQRVHPSTYF